MGKAKIDIKNKMFIITEYCDNKIAHLNIDYDEFVKLYEAKNYKKINFEDNIIQKYYLIYYINKINDINYIQIKKKSQIKMIIGLKRIKKKELILGKIKKQNLYLKVQKQPKKISLIFIQKIKHIYLDYIRLYFIM